MKLPLAQSPLESLLSEQGPQWIQRGIGRAVDRFSSSEPTALRMTDCSVLHRVGYKGAESLFFLEACGVSVPEHPNTALELPNGALVVRLSQTEYWLLDALDADTALIPNVVAQDSAYEGRSYRLERNHTHACFLLQGARSATALSKVCGVDLRPEHFDHLQVAQTSVAKLNAVVVRYDRAQLGYYILCDAAAAEFMWRSLLDAMSEFGGGPAGLADLI